MGRMPVELAVSPLGGESKTVSLEGSCLTLGRAGGNHLCFPDDLGLSRQHLELTLEGSEWVVRDLGSKNGTFLNGNRLTGAHRLHPGDRIVASHVALLFEPSRQIGKTVVFECSEAPSGQTRSVTLGRLLGGEKPAGQWNTPVQALLRAGRELSARRPLPELFEVILNLALEAVGARRGVLLTLEQGQLRLRAVRGDNFHISTAVRDRVIEEKSSLLVEDVQRDEQLRERGSIVRQGVRSLMAAPLQTDERVIGLIYVDTPGLLREFTAEDLNLLTVMTNLGAIRIERERLAEVEQAERQMAAELQQAAEIQRRFLPTGSPLVEGVDLAGYNAPCRTVGGDYYDFLAFPDGRVAVVIGDVAGKGLPAALMMTCLQAKVQTLAESHRDPAALVTHLNRTLVTTCPENRFVTLFCALLDPPSGELVYSNAGHNPPLLARASGEIIPLQEGGPVLGIMPALSFQEHRVSFEPGDALLLYSDGVTEAANAEGEEFGEERLAELLAASRESGAERIVDAVHDAVEQWLAGQPPADDITVVAARRTD
ncbi:MAG: FHA domain-containing protein [Acidobacteria bacterium]|nr:FHA domain-containing protein [Acidobacteriota bacterium]